MNPEILPQGTIPISPGEVLDGKYRVDRVLGVGGMGVVVAATHLQLAQKVALKFMLPEGLRQPGLVERFSREARAAVRLRSDHVARVLDVGMLASGSPYMVMEYLQGQDLATVVETSGPMPVEVAVDSVLQACDAVAEAHSLGIVHRDLKPRNLFLTQRNDGRALVKVLDFGISKDRTGSDLGLTRTTEIMGSPNYMSPEQLKSTKAADERSDIWSLGVILYELLTGRVPFLAETITQLTAMVLTEAPPPIALLRPELPRDLARVVDRCLEKDPARRFPSVAQLAMALERFAPADTRDLAIRIGRIASGAGSNSASQGGLPPVATAGSTSLSWSEKRDLTLSRGRALALAGAIALLVVGAASLGAIALTRFGKTSTAQSGAVTPVVATVVTTLAASSVTTPATSLAAIAEPVEPPAATAARTTGVVDAGAHAATPRLARPTNTNPGVGSGTDKNEPATASSNQAPKYRTNW